MRGTRSVAARARARTTRPGRRGRVSSAAPTEGPERPERMRLLGWARGVRVARESRGEAPPRGWTWMARSPCSTIRETNRASRDAFCSRTTRARLWEHTRDQVDGKKRRTRSWKYFYRIVRFVSPSRCLRSLDTALVITRAFREKHVTPHSYDQAGMYELVSICSGNSLISTSNRSCTASSTAESSSEPMKVMARPLVPKRPALPTRCRYVSAPSGMS